MDRISRAFTLAMYDSVKGVTLSHCAQKSDLGQVTCGP